MMVDGWVVEWVKEGRVGLRWVEDFQPPGVQSKAPDEISLEGLLFLIINISRSPSIADFVSVPYIGIIKFTFRFCLSPVIEFTTGDIMDEVSTIIHSIIVVWWGIPRLPSNYHSHHLSVTVICK